MGFLTAELDPICKCWSYDRVLNKRVKCIKAKGHENEHYALSGLSWLIPIKKPFVSMRKQYWQKVVTRFKESGERLSDFADAYGINKRTLGNWTYRLSHREVGK
jgi:hypothetical protein